MESGDQAVGIIQGLHSHPDPDLIPSTQHSPAGAKQSWGSQSFGWLRISEIDRGNQGCPWRWGEGWRSPPQEPGESDGAHPPLPSRILHLGRSRARLPRRGSGRVKPCGMGRGGDQALRAAAPSPAGPSAARAEPSRAEHLPPPPPRAPGARPHPLQHPAALRTPRPCPVPHTLPRPPSPAQPRAPAAIAPPRQACR